MSSTTSSRDGGLRLSFSGFGMTPKSSPVPSGEKRPKIATCFSSVRAWCSVPSRFMRYWRPHRFRLAEPPATRVVRKYLPSRDQSKAMWSGGSLTGVFSFVFTFTMTCVLSGVALSVPSTKSQQSDLSPVPDQTKS